MENNLTFGEAIEAVKQDKLIQRKGWNGKQMFVFQRPHDSLSIDFIPKVKSLPESVKQYLIDNATEEQKVSGISFTSYLCMKASDGTIVNGWLANQTDMLATDWSILQ